jgi:ATP synthase protein I
MTNVVSRSGAEDEADEPPVRALTREEASALRARLPMISPWRVIATQAVVGLVCVAVVGGVTQQGTAALSALFGVLAVVLPGSLLARGMTKKASSPVASAAGFLVWEMLKIGTAIAMLVIAARVVPQLSWPALLITMVVCLQVNLFALCWKVRRTSQEI